jgi:hypothetical protein
MFWLACSISLNIVLIIQILKNYFLVQKCNDMLESTVQQKIDFITDFIVPVIIRKVNDKWYVSNGYNELLLGRGENVFEAIKNGLEGLKKGSRLVIINSYEYVNELMDSQEKLTNELGIDIKFEVK